MDMNEIHCLPFFFVNQRLLLWPEDDGPHYLAYVEKADPCPTADGSNYMYTLRMGQDVLPKQYSENLLIQWQASPLGLLVQMQNIQGAI
jgi:hypothetical protein